MARIIVLGAGLLLVAALLPVLSQDLGESMAANDPADDAVVAARAAMSHLAKAEGQRHSLKAPDAVAAALSATEDVDSLLAQHNDLRESLGETTEDLVRQAEAATVRTVQTAEDATSHLMGQPQVDSVHAAEEATAGLIPGDELGEVRSLSAGSA